jgi:arginyl-tRNA synthetase
LQYTVVRARNIFRKYAETEVAFSPEGLAELLLAEQLQTFFTGEDAAPFWELVLLAGQLEMVVEQAVTTTEPAVLAKYAFRLAQAFNNFYHRYHILSESDRSRQRLLLYLVEMVNQTLSRTLDLLGIEVPERM